MHLFRLQVVAVFTLSCGRVKTELFESADVTASIYYVSEHAHGALGITQGHFDCLFSFVKVRTAEKHISFVKVRQTHFLDVSAKAFISNQYIFIYKHLQLLFSTNSDKFQIFE